MSNESTIPRKRVNRLIRDSGVGVGKELDKITGLAAVLTEGLNQHYGLDVPFFEVILPAAGIVLILAHRLANFCKQQGEST